jgi:hypothetical protein
LYAEFVAPLILVQGPVLDADDCHWYPNIPEPPVGVAEITAAPPWHTLVLLTAILTVGSANTVIVDGVEAGWLQPENGSLTCRR